MKRFKTDLLNPARLMPWTVEIPDDLQARYATHRHEAFLKLIEARSALLVLAFVALLGFTLFFYRSELHGPDLVTFVMLESVVALVVFGGLAAAHSNLARHQAFSVCMPWLIGMVAALKVATALMVVSEPLSKNEAYMVFLTLLVCVIGMQLSRRQSRVAIGLGAVGFVVLPWANADPLASWHLMGQYLLTGAVCLFIAILKEDLDRMAFLQSCQLDAEQRRTRHLADQLANLANQDHLTRLCNRRHFEERLRDEWIRRAYKEQDMSLLMLEVDHFKALNAEHGRAAGDQCLYRVAEQLRQLTDKQTDLPARYADCGFALLLPDADVVQAYQLANRLLTAIERERIEHLASPVCGHVTLSIGVAACRPSFKLQPDVLVSMAEEAMDSARRKGRGCVSLSNLGLP